MSWQKQGDQLLAAGDYDQLARLYENAVEAEPNRTSHYWYLGLAHLLQGQEELAQMSWMFKLAEAAPEELEHWTEELIEILDAEAQRQAKLDNTQTSWLIRQHLREINPQNINNILSLIQLSIKLKNFQPDSLSEWQLTDLLQASISKDIDSTLLLQTLKELLEYPDPKALEFARACSHYYTSDTAAFIDTLLPIAVKFCYQLNRPDFAVQLAELCLNLKPKHAEVLRHLSCFYSKADMHEQAIKTAELFFENCLDTIWKVQGSYLIQRALLSAGVTSGIKPVIEQHKSLIIDLVEKSPQKLNPGIASFLLTSNFFLPYSQDQPNENRRFFNQIAKIFQENLQANHPDLVYSPYSNTWKKNRLLKIGFVAHTLRGHSVGWLSRWLFKHYNHKLFKSYLYLIHQSPEDHQWFREQVDVVHNFGSEPETIAAKIKEDQIDILIDLDSLTLDITCQVMALKPAPIQVTWLGWDASGIPAIDYYIADPYVLPDNAQEYYNETIWRLPKTYVAVDGFEVGVPTLRRDQLEIPLDAVIYFSGQQGFKRHPDTVRLQLQILKQVPNSYFLIKGIADRTTIQQFFTQIAEEEGVDPARLRFLDRDPSEFVHRANLGIADVVLDTYPYNGATTTLETLWMGIPLVTRVGQQFAARNSYAFMINVGVTEGIAWTDEEYVEWGVRLGTDEALRQQVAWKLKQSRQTSPLWNAKQFTREMEQAFQQMWARYVEG